MSKENSTNQWPDDGLPPLSEKNQKTDTDECIWILNDDWDDGDHWHTACGHSFEFNDGSPTENGCKFCMYCGKPLKERVPESN